MCQAPLRARHLPCLVSFSAQPCEVGTKRIEEETEAKLQAEGFDSGMLTKVTRGSPDCSCNPPTCSFVPFPPTSCLLHWCEEIFPGTSGASLGPSLFAGCAQALTCAGCHTRLQAHRVAEERHRGSHV